jgi:hypothetical protein
MALQNFFQELRRHRELLRRQRAEAEEVAGALADYLPVSKRG